MLSLPKQLVIKSNSMYPFCGESTIKKFVDWITFKLVFKNGFPLNIKSIDWIELPLNTTVLMNNQQNRNQ